MSPVLPGAEPFDHAGGPVGVLLCHGFTGSPQSLRPWALGSLAIALLLLTMTWVIAKASTPDLTPVYFPGLFAPASS